jgi:CRISPR-associated exonuclease Cas4
LPVDYKLGKRRKWDNDDVQLCAQALCLEEMLGVNVPKGAIYHVKSRRRRDVVFTDELRRATIQAIDNVRALMLSDDVPPAVLKPQCKGCSLHAVCLPELTGGSQTMEAAHGRLFSIDGI